MEGMKRQVYAEMSEEETGKPRRTVSTGKLTEEDLVYLNGVFNSLKHIQKVYIDKTGYYHLKAHQYNDNFPEFREDEGKFYAIMSKKAKKYIHPETRLERLKDVPVPNPEFEIVADYTRDFILSEFLKINKK